MNNLPNDGLDPISLSVLILLSGGQKLKIHDFTRALNRTTDLVWVSIQFLFEQKYIEAAQGRYMITDGGVEYLAKKGISASLPEDDPDPKDFRNKFKVPFFGTLTALAEWITPLLVVFFVLTFLTFALVLRSESASPIVYVSGMGAVYIAFVFLYVKRSYHFAMENERLVVFRMGNSIGAKGPGPILVIPVIDHVRRVDMRELSREVKGEICLTKDSLVLNTGFVITWKVDDAPLSLRKLSDAGETLTSFTTAILKTVLSEYEMREALGKRKAINNLVQTKVEKIAAEWGLSLVSIELREMQPPDKVMKQIENRFNADLESAATLAKSDAKVRSLRDFLTIGEGMARNPVAFNLKYLDTLEKIGEGASTKYIIPMEFFTMLQEVLRGFGNRDGNTPGNENNPPGQLPPNGSVQ